MMEASSQAPAKSRLTRALWWTMAALWMLFLCQQVADIARFNGGWGLAALRVAPLSIFLWSWHRDSVIGLIWFELVLLFYFISAVEATFAYHADPLSVSGLTLLAALFAACLGYIRYRGRERRESAVPSD